ncbi:MAG: lysophospholipid acyltransferase family protein [Bacteroidota bacterium]
MKTFSKIILWIFGWKIKGTLPPDLKKCVIIAAPHTSMWDFFYGRLGCYSKGICKINFMIKKEMFRFPLGGLLKWLGAIPVDRSKNSNTVIWISKMFYERESFMLLVTPEGTRKYVENWKRGFYHIAQNAKVPIVLGYVNYKKKEGGFGPVFYPTGNYAEDLKKIQEFYLDKTAKFPENFNLSGKYRNTAK